jgi:hypothetical protein
MQQPRTIKQARSELKSWGMFWARVRGGRSVGKSVTQKFIDSQRAQTLKHKRVKSTQRVKNERIWTCRTGEVLKPVKGVEFDFDCVATSSYTPHEPTSENIVVPLHLYPLDDYINSLQDECKNALRDKYILRADVSGYWVDTAEKLVMQR